MIEKNEVETEDSIFQLGQVSIETEYYDILRNIERTYPDVDGRLYTGEVVLANSGLVHRRRVYSIFDLMGDLGGVIEILLIVFNIMFLPMAEHSFNLKAIKKLFLARTKDEELFMNIPAKDHDAEYRS